MNKDRHITPERITKYRERTLAPADLLEVTRHLATCDECRELALRGAEPARVISALGPEHLSFEQLETMVRNPRAAHGEELEHITFCAMCAAELSSLRTFHESLTDPAPLPRPSAKRFLIPAAAFALAFLAFVTLRDPDNHRDDKPAAPAVIASFLDQGHKLQLDAAGHLRGIEDLSPADQDLVRTALTSGTLPTPATLTDLARTRETQLAPDAAAKPALVPEGPVGTLVSSARPVFRWRAPAGATSFRVAIFDTDFNPVADSGPLTESAWQPAKDLPRDRTYIWTVTATIGGSQVTAPKAPEPEARFQIASETEADALTNLATKSELAFAIAAWQKGMSDEARAAIDRLRNQNPNTKQLDDLAAIMSARR